MQIELRADTNDLDRFEVFAPVECGMTGFTGRVPLGTVKLKFGQLERRGKVIDYWQASPHGEEENWTIAAGRLGAVLQRLVDISQGAE